MFLGCLQLFLCSHQFRKNEFDTILIANIYVFLEWINTGKMVHARTSHTSSVLHDGKVLVAMVEVVLPEPIRLKYMIHQQGIGLSPAT